MHRRTIIVVAALVTMHWVIALLVVGSFSGGGDWRGAVLTGWCIGQLNLVAVWGALAPGRMLLRVPWSIFLGMLLWCALVLGARLNLHIQRIHAADFYWEQFNSEYPGISTPDAALLALVLLGGIFVTMLPLWLAARWWRWRLLPPGCAPVTSGDERQFHLWHLLAGMAAASVALGLGRVVLPPGPLRVAPLDDELWVILPTLAVVNLIVVMPCIWWATRNVVVVAPLLLAWCSYAVVVSVVEVLFLIFVLDGPGSADIEIFFNVALFNLAQCVCVLVSLFALQWAGFRLVRLDDRNLPTSPPVLPVSST